MVRRMLIPNEPSAETKASSVPDWERELDCAFDAIEAGTFAERASSEADRAELQAALWQRTLRRR